MKSIVVICLLAAGVVWADTNSVVSLDRRFADTASALAKEKLDFDQIFARLCRQALDEPSQLPVADRVRSMFGGLWLWARSGGAPVLQGQRDKALHFLGGGVFEGYFDAGRRAAVTKEQRDSRHLDNFFDLDDLAATIMGARWMDVALTGDTEQWLKLWATGEYSLSKSLPKLRWGHLATGSEQEATVEQIEAIDREITELITLPTNATPHSTVAPRPMEPAPPKSSPSARPESTH